MCDVLCFVLCCVCLAQVVDLFHGDARYEVSKNILDLFATYQSSTTDLVLIHVVFDTAKVLHDALTAMSFGDERRQVAALVCKYIEKVCVVVVVVVVVDVGVCVCVGVDVDVWMWMLYDVCVCVCV